MTDAPQRRLRSIASSRPSRVQQKRAYTAPIWYATGWAAGLTRAHEAQSQGEEQMRRLLTGMAILMALGAPGSAQIIPAEESLSGFYPGAAYSPFADHSFPTAEVKTAEAAPADTSATTEASPSASTAPAAFTDEEIAQIDAAAMASLTNGTTGTIVSIVDPKRGSFLKAYGTADTAGTPMSPDMHYRIGSVTKTFTADAVLRLVDQGLVALTDPIAMYVDDIPNGDVVTIQDLLAMRSGLFDFADDQDFLPQVYRRPDAALDDGGHAGDHPGARLRGHGAEPGDGVQQRQLRHPRGGHRARDGADGGGASHGSDRRAGADEHVVPDRRHAARAVRHRLLSDGTMPPPAGGYRDVTLQNPAVAGAAGAIISTVPDMTRYAVELGTGAGLTPGDVAGSGRPGPP